MKPQYEYYHYGLKAWVPAPKVRRIDKRNFSPSAYNAYFWKSFQKNCVQVLADFLGKKMWINVNKKDVREVKS